MAAVQQGALWDIYEKFCARSQSICILVLETTRINNFPPLFFMRHHCACHHSIHKLYGLPVPFTICQRYYKSEAKTYIF